MEEIKDIAIEIIQAILPITMLVVVLQLILFPEPGLLIAQFLIGVVMVSVGLGLFLLGVKVGLLPMGETIGSELPQRGSTFLLLLFAAFLGVAIAVAEPNVRVLATQVDMASAGEVPKSMLIAFVALGLGIFLAIAMARVLLGIPISYILVVGYSILFVLSAFVPAQFVPIAFDSGGVATGPLTVPFILALGVGVASVLGGKSTMGDSFGYLAIATIGPIMAVMLLGVIYA